MRVRHVALVRLLTLLSLVLMLLPDASAYARTTASGTIASNPDSAQEEAPKIDPTDTNQALYIVQLKRAPLAIAPNLPLRSAGADKAAKPDLAAPEALTYKSVLAADRTSALTAIQGALGQRTSPVYIYDTAFNGMALRLNGAQAARIATLPEVVSVEREQEYELTTDAGPSWIGADTIWDASATGVFAATIIGANEVPAVTSSGSGTARFAFDLATSTLSYQIQISGLTEEITAANIYSGAPGSTGSAIAALAATTEPGAAVQTYAGDLVLSSADVTLLQNDGLYVNFGTASNPDGEIRGDISGYKGEGVVVGIVDSGINTTHPSFAAVGGDGYHHLNPLGEGHYKGACDSTNTANYNAAIVCNSKLIGAWTFAQTSVVASPAGEPSPNDDAGHGSHTASTVAGNVLLNVSLNGVTFPRISGVAPHANVISYDVCGYLSSGVYSANCPSAALLAGINQSIADGVDVINYSISGGTSPWTDSVEIAFRNARAAGIVVSTSAGNDGPTTGTVAHVSPWLLSVAASTHNRALVNKVTSLSADGGATLPDIRGSSLTPSLPDSTPLVYAGSAAIGNALCNAFTTAQAALVVGKIVICDRGTNGRVEKAENVEAAGGVGYVLANDAANGSSLVADAFPIPGVHISYADGVTLKDWVAANTNPVAQIAGTVAEFADSNGDIMASFSSRGPRTGSVANILKPDLAAPGVDILAAIANTDSGTPDFGLLSGTSMASPHVAGAAALLVGLHPTWTPGQIQSALMTTGLAPITKEDGVTPATPFDRGTGRVRLERAALAGLVLDESVSNFTSANPSSGGDPRTLNIPSMADPTCTYTCSWTRTVSNTLAVPVTWTASTDTANVTVEPSSFTIPAGGTQTFTTTYNVGSLPLGTYVFGRVTFSAAGGEAPDVAFPIAALPTISDLPSSLIYTAASGVASTPYPVKTVAYSGVSVQRYGMVKGTPKALSLAEGDTDVTTVTVPANTARLVAEIQSSTSLDVDLYIYRDTGNGVYNSSDTLVCTSASSAVLEYCNLNSPTAATYFVEVENYEASSSAADPVNLMTGVVPQTDVGNMVVTFPTTSTGGSVDITLGINEPDSQIGDIWYGRFTVTETGSGSSFGSTNFDFRHVAGIPAVLTPAGTPQSAEVGSAFAAPLEVVVTDSSGDPLSGMEVSFSAPTTGASADLSAATATTDASGHASVTATANLVAGAYTVTASAAGESGPVTATFSLTNTAGSAALLAIAGGTPQTAQVGVAFAAPLQVTVKDSHGNLIEGAQVSFSAPASGASATLSAATATTDASGAASITATAGHATGTYTVTASVAGASDVGFSLTNTTGPAAQLAIASGSPQSAQVGAAFAQPLQVTVTDSYGNVVEGAEVSFSAPASGASATLSAATATTDASGEASVTATANLVAGSYKVTASAAGASDISFSLTNTAEAEATEFTVYLPLLMR